MICKKRSFMQKHKSQIEGRYRAKWYVPETPELLAGKSKWENKSSWRAKIEGDNSSVANDDSSALFPKYSPLFCFWAPVSALFPREKSEHTGGFLSIRILDK